MTPFDAAQHFASYDTYAAGLDPTRTTYNDLQGAYDYLNRRLFGGELPRCLLTFRTHRKSLGYFSADRFTALDQSGSKHEIALDARQFEGRSEAETLSTLAHEMVHLWQEEFGVPPRRGYHDKKWADKMVSIGLMPSTTGEPGGKRVGQRMSHYIVEAGAFDVACQEFLRSGMVIRYADAEGIPERRAAKRASKTPYTCPNCRAKAWAKPNAFLICGECHEAMLAEK